MPEAPDLILITAYTEYSMVNACTPSNQKVEAGRAEGQGYLSYIVNLRPAWVT